MLNFRIIPLFSSLIVIIFAAGCLNQTTQSELSDDEPAYILIGEVQDFVEYNTPSPAVVEFSQKSENEIFVQYSAPIDINNNGEDDLTLLVYNIKESDRTDVLLKIESEIRIPYRTEMEYVRDEFNLVDEKFSFPVGRAIAPGITLKPEDFSWITSEYLFAITHVRNMGYTPAGISSYSSSYIPVQIDNKTGYIKIAFNFDVPGKVPEFRFEETAFLKD